MSHREGDPREALFEIHLSRFVGLGRASHYSQPSLLEGQASANDLVMPCLLLGDSRHNIRYLPLSEATLADLEVWAAQWLRTLRRTKGALDLTYRPFHTPPGPYLKVRPHLACQEENRTVRSARGIWTESTIPCKGWSSVTIPEVGATCEDL